MNGLTNKIFYRLLFSYAVTIAIGALVLVLSVLYLTPRAYQRHMQMNETGAVMTGSGMMMQPSGVVVEGIEGGRVALANQALGNFRAGILDAMGWALLASGVAAFAISIYFSQQILAPLKQFNNISHSISEGNYNTKVYVSGSDEFAQLAESFNSMTEKLRQVEDTRVRMIGDISHELRTPLTIIGGYMEGLSDGVIPAEKETFELVSRETARLTRLVNGLQELSKVEAGSVSLKYDLIRIVELVENLTRQYQPLFEEKKLELRVELSKVTAATPVVLGDADRLTQVFTNLLSNALQFSPENSTVILAGKQEGKKIHFSVKDMGIGLTKDDLGKVFERFYRVDRSRNREFGNGSGIGLSIAKALVDQHKGNIWAESPGVGLGSTFHILLPLV